MADPLASAGCAKAARQIGRRALVGGMAAALVGPAVAPLRLMAQTAAPRLDEIADGFVLVRGLGGNVLIRRMPDGLVLVDSGAADASETLLETLGRLDAARRVQTLFNTHWHLDQVGGNAAVRSLGAEILAHRHTEQRLTTPYYLPAEDRYEPAAPPAAWPTSWFIGGSPQGHETLPVHFDWLLEAHTDGDIYVRFDDSNVIAVGDAISPERDPELDWYGGGWLGGRIDSLERLLEISNRETLFVPSYGAAVDRTYVEAEHALMLGLYDIMFERVRAGESAEDIYRSGALDALPRRFDDPMKLLYDTHKSIWAHYNTISPDIV